MNAKLVSFIHSFFPLSSFFFLILILVKELEFIHKSSSTVGYRPIVFSTTLSHLIATNSSHFIIPFIPIRGSFTSKLHFQLPPQFNNLFQVYLFSNLVAERLKDKLEEFFKCEYELFIEFTGLIRLVTLPRFNVWFFILYLISIFTILFNGTMNQLEQRSKHWMA